MSEYTEKYLSEQVLRGMMDQYGAAWWGTGDLLRTDGAQQNHWPSFVPLEEVSKRLLGWDVSERRVAVEVPARHDDGTEVLDDEGNVVLTWREEPTYKGYVRDDSYELVGRSIHSEAFAGHGPRQWIIDTIAPLLGDDLGIMSAIQLGGMWCVQLCAPEKVDTPQGVSFLPSMALPSSLDGTVASTARKSVGVIECDNTYAADVRASANAAVDAAYAGIKIKHTKNSVGKLVDYREAVITLSGIADTFSANIADLCAQDVTDAEFRTLVQTLVPMPEDENKRGTTVADQKRLDLFGLWTHDQRVSPWRGTAFGAVQAFNTYGQHLATVKKGANRYARTMQNFVAGKVAGNDAQVLDTLAMVLDGSRLVGAMQA